MNSSYEYINGNVILKNSQGIKYATPNTNNMYDVVKQENLIEIIDNKINNQKMLLEKSKENINKYKKRAKNILLKTLLIALLVPMVSFYMGSQVFKSIAFALASCTIALPFEIGCIISSIKSRKYSQTEEKNVESHLEAIEFLKREKEKEEEKLTDLKRESVVLPLEEQKSEFEVVQVDNNMDYDRLNQEIKNITTYNLEEGNILKRQLKK